MAIPTVTDSAAGSSLERVAAQGERHLPALHPETPNHYRHMTAYHFVGRFLRGLDVLDYGCGTGYGMNFLYRTAGVRSIRGLDPSPEAIQYCQTAYPDLAAQFALLGPSTGGGSFDAIVCFQTIEHIADDTAAIGVLRGLLRPGGRLFLSTPNLGAPGPRATPLLSGFHVREYHLEELRRLCRTAFAHVEELGVHGSCRVGGRGLGAERFVGFRMLRRLSRTLFPSFYAPPVSLADFRVSPRGVSQALDLLFVCHND
jgi:2-polyprenyl-3-methyl-5-hydroxy-6-metoxy-1,4-benzoquinol methylase